MIINLTKQLRIKAYYAFYLMEKNIDFYYHKNILWIIDDFDCFEMYKIFILVQIIFLFNIFGAYIIHWIWFYIGIYALLNLAQIICIFISLVLMSYIFLDKGRHVDQKWTILFFLNTNLISTPKENTIVFIPHWTWYKIYSAIVSQTSVLYLITNIFSFIPLKTEIYCFVDLLFAICTNAI